MLLRSRWYLYRWRTDCPCFYGSNRYQSIQCRIQTGIICKTYFLIPDTSKIKDLRTCEGLFFEFIFFNSRQKAVKIPIYPAFCLWITEHKYPGEKPDMGMRKKEMVCINAKYFTDARRDLLVLCILHKTGKENGIVRRFN